MKRKPKVLIGCVMAVILLIAFLTLPFTLPWISDFFWLSGFRISGFIWRPPRLPNSQRLMPKGLPLFIGMTKDEFKKRMPKVKGHSFTVPNHPFIHGVIIKFVTRYGADIQYASDTSENNLDAFEFDFEREKADRFGEILATVRWSGSVQGSSEQIREQLRGILIGVLRRFGTDYKVGIYKFRWDSLVGRRLLWKRKSLTIVLYLPDVTRYGKLKLYENKYLHFTVEYAPKYLATYYETPTNKEKQLLLFDVVEAETLMHTYKGPVLEFEEP